MNSLSSAMCRLYMACASFISIGAKRTLSPALSCAARGRSALITQQGFA